VEGHYDSGICLLGRQLHRIFWNRYRHVVLSTHDGAVVVCGLDANLRTCWRVNLKVAFAKSTDQCIHALAETKPGHQERVDRNLRNCVLFQVTGINKSVEELDFLTRVNGDSPKLAIEAVEAASVIRVVRVRDNQGEVSPVVDRDVFVDGSILVVFAMCSDFRRQGHVGGPQTLLPRSCNTLRKACQVCHR